ncbi:AAA family ATPase [Eubacteriales bacterium OttesenSCG-928-G02]|nr:AAA family ATPase [Eubacteriales bacterium OttesenSCG-928-G02]
MDTSVDKINEEIYLKNTIIKIESRIKELEDICKERFKRIQELSLYTDPKSPEFTFELPSEKALYEGNLNELSKLKGVADNPYFGKINYIDILKDKDTTLYIGKKGVNEFKDTDIPVIDWRAPVANIYYSCKFGVTSYTALERRIPIDLKQKRTLKIRNKIIESIYDADVVLNDDLLVNYLNQNKNLVLNEIVATIQEEQNEIIRKNFKKSLIVQGVAGSGKTTVAIHRISYLLYSYNKDITSDNIILIASNPLFLNYITSMLPDLDVPVIKQDTMTNIIEAEFDYTLSLKKMSNASSGIDYSNDTYIHEFYKLITEAEKEIFDITDIKCFDTNLIYEFQMQRILNNKALSFTEKAKAFDTIVMENLDNKKRDIMLKIMENKALYEDEINETFGLKSADFYSFDYEENYKMLVKKFKFIFTKRVKKLSAKGLYQKFTQKNSLLISSVNDMACYCTLHYKIAKPDSNDTIRHVVIDEAQDFNISIYMFIKQLYPNATFTIMGDLMQNINNDGLDSWDMLKYLFEDSSDYIEMRRSYRNTYEISMFTKKVIEEFSSYKLNINPLKRQGEEVKCITYKGADSKAEQTKAILEELKSSNKKLTAIICKTKSEAEKVQALLGDETMLLDVSFDFLTYGNYVTDIRSAKGLEFDSVIIWDFDDYNEEDIKLLYVALTRALHTLNVFTNKII